MDKLLSDEIERRMNNWAMAMASGYAGGGVAPGFNLMSSNEVRQGSSVPILMGEAEETAKVLLSLTRPEFDSLCLHFVDRPAMAVRYQVMKLKRDAYYRLVESGSKKFWNTLNDLRRKERARTTALLDIIGKTSTIPGIVV